jgi:acyl-CoA synthetase (AMP-forming)/AMP-acid ligase II
LPLYHDMGLITSFLLPLWMGVPVLSIDPFEWTRKPTLLFDAIESFRATHAWAPNFSLVHQVRGVRGHRRWDLGSLTALICCSEPCKAESFDLFCERFSAWGLRPTALQTCYAMAETVFAVTQSPPGAAPRRLSVDRESLQTKAIAAPGRPGGDNVVLLSNGPPIPGCQVVIGGPEGFARDRIVGEVRVAAPWMFSGYHNNPSATQQALEGDWLRTGDLGFIDKGELFIVGRIKDVIIVNGKNIFSHDVEAAASRVAGVKPGRAAAFGRYDPSQGTEQLVVVAERKGAQSDDASVIGGLNRAVLNELGVGCGDIRLVEQGWLVKTTSGKVSRSGNAAKYEQTLLAGDMRDRGAPGRTGGGTQLGEFSSSRPAPGQGARPGLADDCE